MAYRIKSRGLVSSRGAGVACGDRGSNRRKFVVS